LSIPEDISSLRTLVQILLDKVSVLEALVVELKTENESLRAENESLRAENTSLKARLKLDSHNSSKPPSSDGLTKKPAFPRPSNGKKGGQVGHKGKTLEFSSNPDKIVECKAAAKCTCGHDLSNEPNQIAARRQVFDMPIPRLEVTEYHVLSTKCSCCGQIHKGQFPEGVNAPVQYGNGVKAFLSLLINDCKLSVGKTRDLFNDLFSYYINENTIQTAVKICYEKLESTEEWIKNNILAARTAHFDETGIRCAGKLHWLHVASSVLFTYLFVHQKRGKLAIESDQSILTQFTGWAIHDCWASYFSLEFLKHGICGAHLIRELQALIESNSQWAIQFKSFLLEIFNTDLDVRIRDKAQILERYDQIIAIGQLEEPQPPKTGKKGRLKRTKGRNLLERLEKHKTAVMAFAFNADVPFTNNLAERDLRPVKVKQKVSGCFRTFDGASHYARIAGFVSTIRKNKLNVFSELCRIFNDMPTSIAATT
jgi:transposase